MCSSATNLITSHPTPQNLQTVTSLSETRAGSRSWGLVPRTTQQQAPGSTSWKLRFPKPTSLGAFNPDFLIRFFRICMLNSVKMGKTHSGTYWARSLFYRGFFVVESSNNDNILTPGHGGFTPTKIHQGHRLVKASGAGGAEPGPGSSGNSPGWEENQPTPPPPPWKLTWLMGNVQPFEDVSPMKKIVTFLLVLGEVSYAFWEGDSSEEHNEHFSTPNFLHRPHWKQNHSSKPLNWLSSLMMLSSCLAMCFIIWFWWSNRFLRWFSPVPTSHSPKDGSLDTRSLIGVPLG